MARRSVRVRNHVSKEGSTEKGEKKTRKPRQNIKDSRRNCKVSQKLSSKESKSIEKQDANDKNCNTHLNTKKRRNPFKEKQAKKIAKKDSQSNGSSPNQLLISDNKINKETQEGVEASSSKCSQAVSLKTAEHKVSSPNNKTNLTPVKKPNINKLTKKIAELKEEDKNKSSLTEKTKSPVKRKQSSKELSNNAELSDEKEPNKQKSPIKELLRNEKHTPIKADIDSGKSTDEGADDSDMEWEDVAEAEMDVLKCDNDGSLLDNNLPSTSKNVEVTITVPGKKNKSVKWDRDRFRVYFERKFNKFRREAQITAHKVHLLTLLAIGLRRNNLCNNVVLQALGLSLLPQQFIQRNVNKTWDIPLLMRVATWMKNKAPLPGEIHTGNSEATYLMRLLEKKVYFLVVILRALGLSVRLVMSLQTMSMKLNDDKGKNTAQLKTSKPKTPKSKQDGKQKQNSKKETKTITKEASTKSDQSSSTGKTARNRSRTDRSAKNRKAESEYFKENNSSEDEDFDVSSVKTPKRPRSSSKRSSDNNVIDQATVGKKSTPKKGVDIWVEVYIEKEKKWICIDCDVYSVNQPEDCEKHATSPIKYAVAFDNDNSIKDVTARYATGWLTSTPKLRADPEWWSETLDLYKTKKLKRDKKEDSLIKAALSRKPLPTTVSEFKNHPLYALERHLLKFEAIYPETAATLGFCRGEAVYSRDCVHTLHTRELWMKEARVVKTGETPYKIVKGRKSRRKMLESVGEITAELFGRWQTEDYIPPPVIDGKIPRNEYGNVELFKPSMLPAGTSHIQVPGIQRLARKLNIDAVPAVVGFEFHCGFSHPVIDGVVVCEEHEETLLEAWDKEQEQKIRREEEKREKRIFDNWRHLIRSLRIRERLKRKYNMEDDDIIKQETTKERNNPEETEDVTDVSLSWPLNRQEGKTTRADNGHCHVFLPSNHVQDPVTGEWSKTCSCGLKEPLDVVMDNC